MQTAAIEKAMKVVAYIQKNLETLHRYAHCEEAHCTGSSKLNLHVNGHDFSEHVESQDAQDILVQFLEIRLRVQLAYAEDALRLAMLEAQAGKVPYGVELKAAGA